MPLMLKVVILAAKFVIKRLALPCTLDVRLSMLGLFAAMPLILARAWPSALRSGHERA